MCMKTIILLMNMFVGIGVYANSSNVGEIKNSEIIECFMKFDQASRAINMLGSSKYEKVEDVDKVIQAIDDINTFKTERRNNSLYQLQQQVKLVLSIQLIIKCESMLKRNTKGVINMPVLKLPSSVKYSTKGNGDIDQEWLKNPQNMNSFNKAKNEYEKEKKAYLWNRKLQNVITIRKKLLLFPLKYGTRDESIKKLPTILFSIKDNEIRKKWLNEILSTIRKK